LKVKEKTQTSVRIGCMDGVTASLDTTFVLEVFHVVNGTQELIASNWSRSAEVVAGGLSPNTSYILAVHATNDKGRSASVYIGGHTEGWGPPMPATREDRLPVLYIIIAVLLSIMFLSLVLSITAACRRRILFTKEKNMAISVAPLERGDGEDMKEDEELSRSERLREEVAGVEVEDFQMPLIPYTSTPNSHGNGLQRKMSSNGLQRKVSFRDCTCASRVSLVPPRSPSSTCASNPGTLNGRRRDSRSRNLVPNVERTVVRSYSIDKLRSRCYTCNPKGDTPYPSIETGD